MIFAANFLFDGGEIIWLGISTGLLMIGLYNIYRAIRKPKYSREKNDHIFIGSIFLTISLVVTMIILIGANNHYYTTKAYSDLASQNYLVGDLNTIEEVVDIYTPNGCLMSFRLDEFAGKFYPYQITSKENVRITPDNFNAAGLKYCQKIG